MRKKFTLLFASLFLVMGTAWAQVSYTVSPTTGTGYSGSTFFKNWTYTTSDANPAALTFTVGANNMRVVNEQLELFVGSGSTYTLSVPMYYRIVSYSFDFVKESDYSNSVTLTVDGKDYAPTLETQTVTVNNVNATKASFMMSGANKGIKVSNFVVKIERFIELTTDPQNPKWYAIKNVRCGNYVYHNGDGGQMILRGLTGASRKAGKFYFTGEMNEDGTVYTVKIHNAATTKLCKAYNSWDEAGIDWYIKLSSNTANPGFAISNSTDYSGNGTSWNDAGGNGNSVAYWNGGDPGSTWEFVSVSEYDFPEMSTTENPELYCIRNVRQYGKYANYVAEGSVLTQVATLGYGSYWYFVAAEETAPEGWVACKIYNAANATSLQYPDGTFGDQVYYIKKHEWDNNIGFAIKRSTGTSWDGWNDSNGSTVVDYDADDAGSIWWIEKSPKTAASLKSEAATAKNDALNKIASYEYADYYTYADDAIATAKATVEAIDATVWSSAVKSLKEATANTAMTTLEASEKGTAAPAAGDIIQLKNRSDNKYLKANDADAENTDNQNDLATLWYVEEGAAEGNVKLKNVSTNEYVGQIRQSETVAMQAEVANAAQFVWTNQTGVYAVFKDITGGNYAYGHVNGGKLVGWEAGSNPTQWMVAKVNRLTVEYKLNDVVQSTVTEYVRQGTVYTVSSPYDFTAPSAVTVGEEPLEAVDGVFSFTVTEGATVTVELVEDLPFTKTVLNADGSFPANTVWYVVLQHSGSGYTEAWKYDETNGVTTGTASNYTENHLWCFAGSKDDLKIYNKVAGSGMSLTNTDPATMIATNNAVWKMVKSDKEGTFAGMNPFCLQKGNENSYLNKQNGKLKYWSSKDQGSTIRVISVGVHDLADLCLPGIFTLQAERSPLLYDANAADPTKLSSGMVSSITANAKDANQQFMMVESDTDGLYYLYNVGAAKFVDANLNFTDNPEPVLSFEANTANIMFRWYVKIDGKYVVPGDGGTDANKIHHTSTPEEDDGKRYRIEYVGEDNSLAQKVNMAIQYAEAIQALEAAIAEVQAKVDVMDKLGYYSSSNENFEADFNAIIEFKAAITAETSVDAISAQTTAANNLVATFTVLNVPQVGKFYRLKGISGNYIDATSIYNNANATYGQMSMKPENEANLAGTIFYLDEENHFLNYATGTYVNQTREIGTVGNANKGVWSFAASPRTLGTLALSCTTTGNAGQNLHDNEGTRADRCDRNCGDRHDWTVEEVTSLPVALTQVGDKAWATLYAPVALTVPENVTAYYGVINNDDYLTLVEIENEVIPANEGVILCADAEGTYYFAVEGEADDIITNRLAGNVAAKVNDQKTVEQIPYYTLQRNGSSVVFKQYNADFKGFRAYLELTNAQPSIAIRFGEGTTDIEPSTFNPQPSTQIYDLLGRRVEAITKGGIYIVNGKKVVVK